MTSSQQVHLAEFLSLHRPKPEVTALPFLVPSRHASQRPSNHHEPASQMSAHYTDCAEVIQCSCGRGFPQLSAYTNHQWTCKKRKRHLSNTLAKAKLAWGNRKKVRTGDTAGEHGDSSHASGHGHQENSSGFPHDRVGEQDDTGGASRQQSRESSLEFSLDGTNTPSVRAQHLIWRTV